ncbi:MAG: sigma 54-interacting transcriptional regulator [Thermoguttaceae bacterium]|jgi:DNA-binding NtrC family response regulator
MEAIRVLAVDQRPKCAQLIENTLLREGVRIALVAQGGDCLGLLEESPFHVLLAYSEAPGVHDAFLRSAVSIQPRLSVVILASDETAAAVKERIMFARADFLLGPLTAEAILAAVRRAMAARQGSAGNGSAAKTLAAVPRPPLPAKNGSFVVRSAAMRQIVAMAAKIAPTSGPVLLVGEPGVGKATLAHEIHQRSRRAPAPFVHVCCRSLREADLDCALFARQSAGREGVNAPAFIDAAGDGTIFVEELCRLPLWAQVKLFDVLQRHEADWHAGAQPARPRLIAAVTCDPETCVEQGLLDRRLYYYLNAFRIDVPPLRYRQEAIRPLADHFLAVASASRGRIAVGAVPTFSAEAWQCLVNYGWPGNIPQLASVVARCVVLAEDGPMGRELVAEALGNPHPSGTVETISVPLTGGLKGMEDAILREVIQRCRGNKAAAARALGLHRRTLYRLLEQGQQGPEPEEVGPPLLSSNDGGPARK